MNLLAPALVLLLTAPLAAQDPLAGAKFKHNRSAGSAPVPEEKLGPALAVAKELEAASGFKFTGEKSEVRGVIEDAARKWTNGSNDEIRKLLVKPLLGFFAIMGTDAAIGAEIKFWTGRGYGVRKSTKRKMAESTDRSRESEGLGKDANITMNAGQRAYSAASDILYAELVNPKYMQILQSAAGAFQRGTYLGKLYDEGKADTSDFKTAWSIRNADLSACAFTNHEKAVMPGTAMTASQLVPAEGGWRKRNAAMFRGLVAPLAWEGVSEGLVTGPTVEETKKAVDHEDARWGFSMIESFTSAGNAAFLNKLVDKMQQ